MRWWVGLLFLVAGCRGCAEHNDKAGPPMPKGMLVPAPSGSTAIAPRGDYALHHERIPSAVELVRALPTDTERNEVDGGSVDAVYLSLDAMAVFHDAFARAYQPGTFDLFVPRIVDGKALAAELRTLLERLAPSTVRDAIARNGRTCCGNAEARRSRPFSTPRMKRSQACSIPSTPRTR